MALEFPTAILPAGNASDTTTPSRATSTGASAIGFTTGIRRRQQPPSGGWWTRRSNKAAGVYEIKIARCRVRARDILLFIPAIIFAKTNLYRGTKQRSSSITQQFAVLTFILTTCAIRNPSGMTYSHAALDLLLRKLSIILQSKIILLQASY